MGGDVGDEGDVGEYGRSWTLELASLAFMHRQTWRQQNPLSLKNQASGSKIAGP